MPLCYDQNLQCYCNTQDPSMKICINAIVSLPLLLRCLPQITRKIVFYVPKPPYMSFFYVIIDVFTEFSQICPFSFCGNTYCELQQFLKIVRQLRLETIEHAIVYCPLIPHFHFHHTYFVHILILKVFYVGGIRLRAESALQLYGAFL